MVGASPEQGGSGSPKRLTVGLLMSMSYLMALLAKQARRVSTKLNKTNSIKNNRDNCNRTPKRTPATPRSPLTALPKQLITRINNKAITFLHKKRVGEEKDDIFCDSHENFGGRGVWQRAILMGDKCQPLDFPGVIYYDSNGKQLDELPLRSPRASPLPGYLARKQEL